jgi:hypothetical protein
MTSSDQVWAALRVRYAAPRYATLAEVRDATGLAHTRTADAIILCLWGSDRYELMGVEIKVSRSDFLQEIKDIKKADALLRYCDRWYLAAGDSDIVKEGELPAGWGLLVPRGDKLVVAKEAPKLDPIPITRKFLGGLMRAAESQLGNKREIDNLVERARREGVAEGRKYSEHEIGVLTKVKTQLEDRMRVVNKAVGQFVDQGNCERIAEMLRAIYQANKRNDMIKDYEYAIHRAKIEAEELQGLVDKLKAFGEHQDAEKLPQGLLQ